MSETRQLEVPRRVRALRRAEGVVAQYIHELSERHAADRRRRSPRRSDARPRVRPVALPAPC